MMAVRFRWRFHDDLPSTRNLLWSWGDEGGGGAWGAVGVRGRWHPAAFRRSVHTDHLFFSTHKLLLHAPPEGQGAGGPNPCPSSPPLSPHPPRMLGRCIAGEVVGATSPLCPVWPLTSTRGPGGRASTAGLCLVAG